ncbi:MAG TPA: hypothetical protein VF480_11650 [Verrucomicrobiae bacterium]
MSIIAPMKAPAGPDMGGALIDEMQKGIRAKDDEHQSKQDAGNDGGDFHAAMLNGIGDISIIKVGGSYTRSRRSLRTATI